MKTTTDFQHDLLQDPAEHLIYLAAQSEPEEADSPGALPHLENGWAAQGSRLDLGERKAAVSPVLSMEFRSVAYLWCQALEPGDTAPRVLAFHGRELQMSDCHQQQFDYRALQRTELPACGSLATVAAAGARQGKSHTEGPRQEHTVGAQYWSF